jgi:hypothetical protein
MISKIEVGATGARFPSIERLAQAVQVDPAELFTSDLPKGSMKRGAFGEISAKLSSLPETDLVWISALLDVASGAGTIDSKIKPFGRTNCGEANQVCRRSKKEKSISKIVPKFSTNFSRLTGPFTSSNQNKPRIHDRCFRGLRHGWMAGCHFDGWFKMTVWRRRFRPDCLGSKGSDGLDAETGR